MAYIITGATGHIGNNIARTLINSGYNVKLLVRKIDKSIKGLNAKIIIGDIFNRDFLLNNIKQGDTVLHLAGVIDIKNNKKEETLKINYEGTKTIIDVALLNKVERFIYFSTVDCIYKKEDEIIKEPSDIYPDMFIDNYSYSKALATKYVMDKRKEQDDVKINILYPSAVIGINDYKPSAIGKVVLDIIDNKMQFGIKGGYNFVDVEDIALGTKNIIENSIEGDFLLTGTPVTIYEFYNTTNKVLNKKKRTIRIPLLIVKLFMPFVPYLSKFVLKTINENYNYDNTKMKEILKVNTTLFEDTIKKSIAFFKQMKKGE